MVCLLASAGHQSFGDTVTGPPVELPRRPGIALSNVRFYADSSFLKPTDWQFEKGTLFQVIGETYAEHDDNAQEQTFKWYRLQSPKGLIGWIQGDAVAVIVPEQRLDPALRHLHRRQSVFTSGFEQAVIWIAAVNGHDKMHGKAYLNPPYSEIYTVITNDQWRSVFLHCGRTSQSGHTAVRSLTLEDVTGDQFPDFTLITGEAGVGSSFENKELEIFSFQAGGLSKVFSERLTLTCREGELSPAYGKSIDINAGLIRVAYAAYDPCGQSADTLPLVYCLEYVTYTLIWDRRIAAFREMYPESRAPVTGHAKGYLAVQQLPAPNAPVAGYVTPEQLLTLEKHCEYRSGGREMPAVDYYFYIRTPAGRTGYLPAAEVAVAGLENAAMLNRFYTQSPPDKNEWQPRTGLVLINGLAVPF